MKRITSTIAFKLIVPIVSIFIIIVAIALNNKINDLREYSNEKALLESNNLMQALKNKTQSAENSALFTSSIYSSFSAVKWAYSVYNKTGNIDSAYTIIKRNVMPSVENVEKITHIPFKLHFHLPTSKSLFRSWTNEYGDNLKSFRNSINEISRNHNPIKTIEIGKSGFVIRGISPIFDNKGNYLGSVETIFPFSMIFDRIMDKKDKESYALYINKEKVNDVIDNDNNISSNTGNYMILKSSSNFIDDYLDKNDFVFKNNDEIKHKITNNCVCTIAPIKDYQGNIIGVSAMQIDISDTVAEINQVIIQNIFMAIGIILLVIFVIYAGIKWVVITPINQLSRDINKIAKGKLIAKKENNNSGVIAVIYNSFNVMLERMKQTTEFANKIGEGDLDAELENLSEEDVLGQSLVRMRDNLRTAKQIEEQNKVEEQKRAWATKGFAEFGEILRRNNNDITEFANEIISNLVKYTESNQGGLFILNDNDENDITLELVAMYAFNRKKYADKTIKLGEGLVGTCAIEKETIFMTEVPDDYISITSGLGGANPRCILIVPLKLEDKVFGVIELASFNVYEDYQIKFIEKLAESIAATLHATKTNILTQELLEQSQQQAEELAATEEEMRQNLEEMQATQEQLEEHNIEIKRKNNEMRAQMNAINRVALVSKTDLKGIITYVNDLFCEIAGYSREELLGKPHNIVRHPDMPRAAFKNLWDTIQAGKVWSGKVKNQKKDGGYYWVDANISPIYDENGQIKEYIAIRYLITDYIDNEETTKLVKKLFPDTKFENKKRKKTENNLKENNVFANAQNQELIHDSKLIKELKQEHKEISVILETLQKTGTKTEKRLELLSKSKYLLLSHLQKEDKELYPLLRERAIQDEIFKNILDTFGNEMDKITKFVLEFYDKYTDEHNINKQEFLKDLSKFLVTFKDRISKEEMVLYKAFNKYYTEENLEV